LCFCFVSVRHVVIVPVHERKRGARLKPATVATTFCSSGAAKRRLVLKLFGLWMLLSQEANPTAAVALESEIQLISSMFTSTIDNCSRPTLRGIRNAIVTFAPLTSRKADSQAPTSLP
jgi:hypothetical protein